MFFLSFVIFLLFSSERANASGDWVGGACANSYFPFHVELPCSFSFSNFLFHSFSFSVSFPFPLSFSFPFPFSFFLFPSPFPFLFLFLSFPFLSFPSFFYFNITTINTNIFAPPKAKVMVAEGPRPRFSWPRFSFAIWMSWISTSRAVSKE